MSALGRILDMLETWALNSHRCVMCAAEGDAAIFDLLLLFGVGCWSAAFQLVDCACLVLLYFPTYRRFVNRVTRADE